MTWNYRVVVKRGFYGIHEVYYDEDGSIKAATENPVFIGSSSRSLSELITVYERMGEALTKRVIPYTDIGEDE